MEDSSKSETVLVIGATGIIGVSAVIGALRSGRKVLAVVRSTASAEKMFQHVGTREGIATVEADVSSDAGVQGVVDLVEAGKLPAFQHVYSTVGVLVPTSPIWKVDTASWRTITESAIDSQFFAYRATVPYLIRQGYKSSTWTLMTGYAGELGSLGVSAIGQGALFSMANVASRENAETNVRFNEVMLGFRVDYDQTIKDKGLESMPASEFGHHYEKVLAQQEIKGSRISLLKWDDMKDLPYKAKV